MEEKTRWADVLTDGIHRVPYFELISNDHLQWCIDCRLMFPGHVEKVQRKAEEDRQWREARREKIRAVTLHLSLIHI